MKKIALLCLVCLLFLTALEKPRAFVSFLQPVANGIKHNTNVPVYLPTYWSEQTVESNKYTSVKVKSYENGYTIYFLSMNKPYRANDSALFHHPESSEVGELSGFVGSMSTSDRPSNFVYYKKKDGAKLWIQPWIRSIIYAKRGPWVMLFDGDNGDEPYQQANELFNAMEQVKWLKDKNVHEGHITILGTRRAANTSISWESDNGYVYHLFYRGPIKEAVKIVDSLRYVK
ncbi:hypothetical protein [Neobacillus vireti]|uniref:hypothetical protein n=1 Tax=Neobacillus vireti TaxID=220686 RepID=UPI002FFDB4C7